MARAGDNYEVEIKLSHIDWGRHRYTNTRDKIAGEAYVKIPKDVAVDFDIRVGDTFTAHFSDGFDSFTARAAGNTVARSVYAKQFQGDGDLKAFGRWYAHVGAEVGDKVLVEFLSPDNVQFTLIKF